MNSNKKYIMMLLATTLITFGFVYQESSVDTISATLITKKNKFIAGDQISLTYELNEQISTDLLLQTSNGSILISSEIGKFELPNIVTKQKGIINYTLLFEGNTLHKGSIEVNAATNTKIALESYIGPPSIIAGGIDYSMHVVVPTDIYDNPLPNDTPVVLKHQFLEHEVIDIVLMKDMIAWKREYSYPLSGKMLVSSQVGSEVSKELSVVVFPGLSSDFTITSSREHSYADGNQVVDFKTSILEDTFGNSISDGTLVDFIINTGEGRTLKTQASSINGIATGKIIHPDYPDKWSVKAYISGVAESNSIDIQFKPVLSDFKVEFANNNREIRVGPIQSFMKQLIPDGIFVTLKMTKSTKTIATKIGNSKDGMVIFLLPEDFYPKGAYDISIRSMGIQKEYKDISIE